jgi:zinc D-Ala-D-Ala carboxypeptidase
MKLSPHFDLSEFTRSDIAVRHNIDNTLPDTLLTKAMDTASMMERIRAHLSSVVGYPVSISVTSGYRCLPLNRAVGSKDYSDHPKMLAIDFTASGFGDPFTVASELATVVDALGIGQLIHEFGYWVHVSTAVPANPNNRTITISNAGVQVGIQRIEI